MASILRFSVSGDEASAYDSFPVWLTYLPLFAEVVVLLSPSTNPLFYSLPLCWLMVSFVDSGTVLVRAYVSVAERRVI